MKQLYILPVLLLLGSFVSGQNLDDAVRFSRTSNFGSARSAAMGGAFGALGGDITTLSYNPAGIGVFRKSEIAFTPYLNFSNTKSGHGSIENTSFQVGQLGAVFGFYTPNFDWKGFNFGINYTNMNNFNRKLDQLVDYSETSITNVWAFESLGLTPGSYNMTMESALAYNTKLIYLTPGDTENDYFSILEVKDEETGDIFNTPVRQQKTIKEDGYQGEYAFSFGTNYKDKLYLGMTIGIQSVYYKMKSTYDELASEESFFLDQFFYDQYYKINGVGTNLKFGLIYRPIPEIRIGAAIHTPTWYNMNYDYTAAIEAFYWGMDPEIDLTKEFYGDYGTYSRDFSMRTPWRAILSLATVIKQRAILSADYEYVDYTNANFSDADDNMDYYDQNQDIQDLLRSTHNVRIGAEYRFNSIFSLRAGYSYQASPYKYNEGKDNQIQAISGGFGLNFGVFYCDAAYVHKYSKDQTIFYSGTNPFLNNATFTSQPITNKYTNNEARITLGVRF